MRQLKLASCFFNQWQFVGDEFGATSAHCALAQWPPTGAVPISGFRHTLIAGQSPRAHWHSQGGLPLSFPHHIVRHWWRKCPPDRAQVLAVDSRHLLLKSVESTDARRPRLQRHSALSTTTGAKMCCLSLPSCGSANRLTGVKVLQRQQQKRQQLVSF